MLTLLIYCILTQYVASQTSCASFAGTTTLFSVGLVGQNAACILESNSQCTLSSGGVSYTFGFHPCFSVNYPDGTVVENVPILWQLTSGLPELIQSGYAINQTMWFFFLEGAAYDDNHDIEVFVTAIKSMTAVKEPGNAFVWPTVARLCTSTQNLLGITSAFCCLAETNPSSPNYACFLAQGPRLSFSPGEVSAALGTYWYFDLSFEYPTGPYIWSTAYLDPSSEQWWAYSELGTANDNVVFGANFTAL